MKRNWKETEWKAVPIDPVHALPPVNPLTEVRTGKANKAVYLEMHAKESLLGLVFILLANR